MKKKYEKIIRRRDGSRVRIEVELTDDRKSYSYNTAVFACEKGKRTWKHPHDTNDYIYRGLSMEDRRKLAYDSQFSAVSKEELLQAKTEFWESLRPTLKN